MFSLNERILLHITMLSENNPDATKKVDSTYYRFNNVLKGKDQFPNISNICKYCSTVNNKLGAYIRNKCLNLRKEDTVFEPSLSKTNSILNKLESSEQKNIRIMLYPGNRDAINDLNMDNTTHNMIIQFNEGKSFFSATEKHTNPPSFYQNCINEECAVLYCEALMIDACICHYLGISEVAYHHDNKKHISLEKVQFLKEIVQKNNLQFLTSSAQELVKHVASKLKKNTPYISFLSIFTIAPLDVYKDTSPNLLSFFEDYCKLWYEFQRWYFSKHGRLFSKQMEISDPINTLFDRNKYQGQISPVELTQKIEMILNNPTKKSLEPPFGEESRYAVVIIKHMPENSFRTSQFEALFSGQLHQAKWDIIYWGDIERYNDIISYLEFVPFLICD